MKKYLHITQHWRARVGNKQNPIALKKRTLSNMNDIDVLKSYFGPTWPLSFTVSNKDQASFGRELYEICDDGNLIFMSAHYDSSD